MKHINVYVVLLQRTLLLDAAGPLEVLRVANREQQDIRFEVHYIGPETPIVSSIGITLAKIEPLPKTLPNDAMVVLSGDVDYIMMPGMQVAPRQVGDRDAVVGKWLQGSWTGIPARRITVAGRSLRQSLRRQKYWRTACLWRIESATQARVGRREWT
ncbi:hypothetical protein [Edaphobacter aggregans]|uniref:hypothetical protein n=1 Tax=Edaphobacter aggregans TaxID=570835 RepID=UPI000F7417E6|nr:hypothetical protein [Edaphobacter aggregans]